MKDGPGELVASFSAIGLNEDTPSIDLSSLKRRRYSVFISRPSSWSARASRVGRSLVCSVRVRPAAWIRRVAKDHPVLQDQLHIDFVRGEFVEYAIVGFPIDAPEPRAADIGDARAELVTKQVEYSKNRICISGSVGHDLGRLKFGLLFENDGDEIEAVAQRAGDGHSVETGELVEARLYYVMPRS